MSAPKQLFYATLGFGDLAIERARKASENIDLNSTVRGLRNLKDLRAEAERISLTTVDRLTGEYQKLVKRGEKTYKGIRSSAPTKRAAQQTKTAKSQSKAAATSVKKAANANIEAVKQAGAQVG